MNRVSCYLLGAAIFTTGCSMGRQHEDLYQFMEQARNAPRGQVEPLPAFGGYKPYNYTSLRLHSPFEVPLKEAAGDFAAKKTVKPDESRRKEYLEGFNFTAFSLVGTIQKDGTLWSLVRFINEEGKVSIAKVKVSNYLGKNHGKIVANTPNRLEVVEIVPDGKGNWLERPRTLALVDRD